MNDPPTITADGGLQWADGEVITGARLCTRCGHVHGKLLILGDGEPVSVSSGLLLPPGKRAGAPVRGSRPEHVRRALPLLRLRADQDTVTVVELLLRHVSRARVLAANNGFGAWVIPIGRHSMMHGMSLGSEATDSEEQVEAFVGEVRRAVPRDRAPRRLDDRAGEAVPRHARPRREQASARDLRRGGTRPPIRQG